MHDSARYYICYLPNWKPRAISLNLEYFRISSITSLRSNLLTYRSLAQQNRQCKRVTEKARFYENAYPCRLSLKSHLHDQRFCTALQTFAGTLYLRLMFTLSLRLMLVRCLLAQAVCVDEQFVCVFFLRNFFGRNAVLWKLNASLESCTFRPFSVFHIQV